MDSCLRRNEGAGLGLTEAEAVNKFPRPHPPPANFLNQPTRHCR